MGGRGVVVMGYGSELRSDDGAGRHVAAAVGALRLPGVTVRSVHQLAPEHAADLVGRRRAVFVDAAAPGGLDGVAVRAVTAAPPGWRLTHHLDPAALLALAATLGPPPDDAVLVTVPARDLGLGTELSAATAADVEAAVAEVGRLCCLHAGRPSAAADAYGEPRRRRASGEAVPPVVAT